MVYNQGGTWSGERSKRVGGTHELSYVRTLEGIVHQKDKDTKGIIIRKPKVLSAVMFYDSNYATDKETIKIVCGLVSTLGGKLLMCLSKTYRTVTLSSIEAECMEFSACAQEVKFASMLLGDMT